jgi:DNA-binding MarR family transcriptional regulator
MKEASDPLDTALETANRLHRGALRLLQVLRASRAKGLTLSQLGVLGRLYREGKATATELAGYMRIKPQSLTRLVADLERRKLIVRRSKEEDRRQSLLEITEAGTRLLDQDLRDQRAKLAQVIGKELIPAEQELLRIAAGLMDRVAEGAELEIAPQSVSKRKNRRGVR